MTSVATTSPARNEGHGMESLAIIALSILSAVIYGVLHDQITARVCVEYFTIGHPRIFGDVESPTLLAFGWGFVATWWAGAGLGIPLAFAARAGDLPKRSVRSLIRPILQLLGVMAVCAFLCGIGGFLLAGWDVIHLPPGLAERIPREKHRAFIADAAAHQASYAVGFLGGAVVVAKVWRSRVRHA